ncbi:MAG: cation transporter [bacterium]|nr:cation transporter [bacterium]
MKKTYGIEVDCANCAAKMEEAVKRTPGVKDAALSFMTLKLKVEFEEGADIDSVMREALKNCKKVEQDCEIFI